MPIADPVLTTDLQIALHEHAGRTETPSATFSTLWGLMEEWARANVEAAGLPFGPQQSDIRSFSRSAGLKIEVYELGSDGKRFARGDRAATMWVDGTVDLPQEILPVIDG